MRVLIRAGARLCYDRWGNTPVADADNFATRTGDSEGIRLLRAIEGRSVETSNATAQQKHAMLKYAAMTAVSDGDVDRLKRLIKDGLNVNMSDYDRRTPLMVRGLRRTMTVAYCKRFV